LTAYAERGAVHCRGAFLDHAQIHHSTAGRFHKPVSFGPHCLMLRRESRDLSLLASSVTVTLTPP
jgi:hypothetical protein